MAEIEAENCKCVAVGIDGSGCVFLTSPGDTSAAPGSYTKNHDLTLFLTTYDLDRAQELLHNFNLLSHSNYLGKNVR